MKKSKAKQVILSIAIALVLVLFVAYGMNVFYESPKYQDFCDDPRVPKLVGEELVNESVCLENGGRWTPRNYPCLEDDLRCPDGFCDQDFECREEYQQEREVYNRNVFITSSILGLAIVILGVLLKLESVSVGIMGGGALLIVYGTIRYWGELGKYIRLVILGLVLAALICLGYKKFRNK